MRGCSCKARHEFPPEVAVRRHDRIAPLTHRRHRLRSNPDRLAAHGMEPIDRSELLQVGFDQHRRRGVDASFPAGVSLSHNLSGISMSDKSTSLLDCLVHGVRNFGGIGQRKLLHQP